jgi:hypothetical protein
MKASPRIICIATITLLLASVPATAMAVGIWERFWTDLTDRPGGPMSFRFVLQPVMAAIAAWHDAKKDAATGRSPYFWTVLTDPAQRRVRLAGGVKATSKILLVGLAMDLIYQIIVFKTFYPMEAIVIAIALAFVPYLLLRGPFARLI